MSTNWKLQSSNPDVSIRWYTCGLDSSTLYPFIGVLELARSQVLMFLDSGFSFPQSPIWCHLYPTSSRGPTLPHHRRDIANCESKRKVSSVLENPNSSNPDILGFLDTHPRDQRLRAYRSIALRDIATPVPATWCSNSRYDDMRYPMWSDGPCDSRSMLHFFLASNLWMFMP
jgi:hypothetical protein